MKRFDANIPYRSLSQDQVAAILAGIRAGLDPAAARAEAFAIGVTAADYDRFLTHNREQVWRARVERAVGACA